MLEVQTVLIMGVETFIVKELEGETLKCASTFTTLADAELFVRAKEVQSHWRETTVDDPIFSPQGLPYWIVSNDAVSEVKPDAVSFRGVPLEFVGPNPLEQEVKPLGVELRLMSDGSVRIHDHEILEEWGKRHGKLLEIRLTDVSDDDVKPDVMLVE